MTHEVDLIKKTLRHLNPCRILKYYSCFSCLLTKPNIRYYLEEGDEYFDYLYNKVGIFTLIIICQMKTQSIKCLVMNIIKVFKHCVDKYPNVHPVRDYIFNKKNFASCRVSKLILHFNFYVMII